MLTADQLAKLKKALRRQLALHIENVDAARKKIAGVAPAEVAHELEWSKNFFEAAARVEAWTVVLNSIENTEKVDEVLAREVVRRRAHSACDAPTRRASRSSRPPAAPGSPTRAGAGRRPASAAEKRSIGSSRCG